MERIALDVEGGHFGVGDFDAFGVPPSCGRRSGSACPESYLDDFENRATP